MKPWTLATVVVAAFFFALAVSNAVYETTSPIWLSWHVALRKVYSIAAFAIVGACARRALAEHGRAHRVPVCVAGVAAYSGAIEVAQWLHGSHEGLVWNGIDVVCGAVGGALSVADLIVRRTERTP